MQSGSANKLYNTHWAAENGRLKIVKVLLDKGANINVHSRLLRYTPLHWAAENGHLEVVKVLLDKGGDVNMQNLDANTPLHCAAENGHEHVVRYLVEEKKVDIN